MLHFTLQGPSHTAHKVHHEHWDEASFVWCCVIPCQDRFTRCFYTAKLRGPHWGNVSEGTSLCLAPLPHFPTQTSSKRGAGVRVHVDLLTLLWWLGHMNTVGGVLSIIIHDGSVWLANYQCQAPQCAPSDEHQPVLISQHLGHLWANSYFQQQWHNLQLN